MKTINKNIYLRLLSRIFIKVNIMADKEKTIEALQAIVTGLSANSFQHRIQSKIFAGLGFQALGDNPVRSEEHTSELQSRI